jgi:hypothetical protein
MKPSSLVWVRLNSCPVIAASKPTITRAFVAGLVGRTTKLKSLDNLEPQELTDLNQWLTKHSNDQLEQLFLEHLKGAQRVKA